MNADSLACQRQYNAARLLSWDGMLPQSPLAAGLTEVPDLSAAVGRSVLTGMLDGLHLVQMPALAMDRNGLVLDINAGANAVFDSDFRIRNSRLLIRDKKAREALERLVAGCAAKGGLRPRGKAQASSVIAARREAKRPVLMKLLPVCGAASALFLSAKFILVMVDLETARGASPKIISETFPLTAAEAKVASMIAAGSSPAEIASRLQVSRETVRNQIKAVFGKTGTHRQSELAALLSRIQI